MFYIVKNLLKGFGATRVQGAVRESANFWTKIANAKERYKIVEVKI